MKLNIIVCLADHSILGVKNDLYVKIKDDMKYFKKITCENYYKGKPNVLIMGYNTFTSIGKPLKDRVTIVISKNHKKELDSQNILNFSDLNNLFQFLEIRDYVGKIFVIGGATLYEDVFTNYSTMIDAIYYTKVITPSLSDEEYLLALDNNIVFYKMPIYDQLEKGNIALVDKCEKHGKGLVYDLHESKYVEKDLHYDFNVYQNTVTINKEELQYINVLKDILKKNNVTESRNANVLSEFGVKMEFNLQNGFPILTTKRVPWKTVLRELLWFMSGSTDNRVLKQNKVNIWNANASKEFLDSRGLTYEEDDLGPVYGFQWRHFGAEYVDFDTNYDGKGTDQLKYIIDEIKANPSSRRLILNSWNAADIDKMALPPCHVMVQFNIDKEFIDCQLYQRSGDMFLGVPFNITSYAFLLAIIGKITGYTPRKLIHIIGDAHIYEQHIDAVNNQLFRTPNRFPYLAISDRITDIDDILEDDFNIINYDCYSTISAPMIA